MIGDMRIGGPPDLRWIRTYIDRVTNLKSELFNVSMFPMYDTISTSQPLRLYLNVAVSTPMSLSIRLYSPRGSDTNFAHIYMKLIFSIINVYVLYTTKVPICF